MFDVEALAKQVLLTENFLPESYLASGSEEVKELRAIIPREQNINFEFSDTAQIMKFLSQNPQRKYRIGDVVQIVGVKEHILRYWEKEFKFQIRPQKNAGGQRLYSLRDIENVFEIKKLLVKDKFSVEGAKNKLKMQSRYMQVPTVSQDVLVVLKEELEDLVTEINDYLNKQPGSGQVL
jgi:DNA-binding transcriptional MerR regulator